MSDGLGSAEREEKKGEGLKSDSVIVGRGGKSRKSGATWFILE